MPALLNVTAIRRALNSAELRRSSLQYSSLRSQSRADFLVEDEACPAPELTSSMGHLCGRDEGIFVAHGEKAFEALAPFPSSFFLSDM
jgi:hypothetical protein